MFCTSNLSVPDLSYNKKIQILLVSLYLSLDSLQILLGENIGLFKHRQKVVALGEIGDVQNCSERG